jgi:hypothetical protein
MQCPHRSARPSRARSLILAVCCLLALAIACDEDSERTPTQPATPDYLANDSPGNLVANLVMAMEAEDAEGYAALLYDGALLATDGLTYAPYKFYFSDELEGFPLPDTLSHAEELACMGALLGGEPGVDFDDNPVPGMKSLAVGFLANGVWATPIAATVEGDTYPEDVLWRSYETTMLITLKSTYLYNTVAFSVQDRLIVHCIPVQVGAETEWRLWKWRDVIDLGRAVPDPQERTESSTWGIVKWLYMPAGGRS